MGKSKYLVIRNHLIAFTVLIGGAMGMAVSRKSLDPILEDNLFIIFCAIAFLSSIGFSITQIYYNKQKQSSKILLALPLYAIQNLSSAQG